MMLERKRIAVENSAGMGRRRDGGNAPNQRQLSEWELGGVIFGATSTTFDECIQKRLFGLPRTHIRYVEMVKKGLPLFLFNYTERKLYGLFEAASDGALDIDPSAWTVKPGTHTQFPAQVSVGVWGKTLFLLESDFKPAILENYFKKSRFHFELDHQQTRDLVRLFNKLTEGAPPPVVSSIPTPTASSASPPPVVSLIPTPTASSPSLRRQTSRGASMTTPKEGEDVEVTSRRAITITEKGGENVEVASRGASITTKEGGESVQATSRGASLITKEGGENVKVISRGPSLITEEGGEKFKDSHLPHFAGLTAKELTLSQRERYQSRQCAVWHKRLDVYLTLCACRHLDDDDDYDSVDENSDDEHYSQDIEAIEAITKKLSTTMS